MTLSKARPRIQRAFLLAVALFACTAIWQPAVSSADAPTTITIAPSSPTVDNCYPFGLGSGWTPYAAFIYKNIPPFQLKPGDTVAFDLGAQNDVNIQLEIAMARTTTNGGTVQAQPFQKLVDNTQTPLNPRGDTTAGNFELQFTAQAPFIFPGGGLIIRFSNPSASYMADGTCTAVVEGAMSNDPSGFFVQRAYADADGVFPWDGALSPDSDIGGFRLTIAPKPTNVFSFGGVHRHKHAGTATLPVRVPGPGTLDLTGNGVKPQRAGGGAAASTKTVTGAGTLNLLVKAKRGKKHKLNTKGKVKVKINVTFTPTYGDPNTQTKRVKLVKKH